MSGSERSKKAGTARHLPSTAFRLFLKFDTLRNT